MGGLGFVVACAAQLILTAVYAGKIYPGVTVAGQEIGGLTRFQARDRMEQQLEGYEVKLVAAGKTYQAKPEDIGADYNLNATLDEAYLQGRDQWFLPLALWQSIHGLGVEYAVSTDQSKFRGYVQKIVTETGKAPTDASIIIENGEPKVQNDANGIGLSEQQVSQVLTEQIANLKTEPAVLAISSQPARIKPDHLGPAVAQTKELLSVPVTITYEGRVFRPTPKDMGEWISYDKSTSDEEPGLKPKVDLDGIKHYLQSVAKQVNVDPINKKIKIENGVTSVEREGTDGLQLNQDQLADQIAKAFIAKQPFSGEAPTTKVGFKTEYNRVVTLAYGKYIEVNLSRQRLWVYQDQKVIFESPITSGATGAGFPTVQGLFSIQAKQTNRNLNGYAIGYNYNVFVKYWMPFFRDYGMHDASWRSSFGGSDYYYGGSHGCVNMPDEAAAFIYGWADVGTPVWVHS